MGKRKSGTAISWDSSEINQKLKNMRYTYWIIIILVIASCKKEPKEPKETCTDGIKNQDEAQIDCGGSSCTPCAIEYPTTGTYGINILNGTDTLRLTETEHSFKATIPNGSSLKIELNSINGEMWGYSLGSNVGWSISEYSNGVQTFEAINGGNTDLQIARFPNKTGQNGSVLIKYFENGNTETKRKVMIWE